MEAKYADLEEGRRLRSLGFYSQAVTVFSRAAENPTRSLEFVFEFGETLSLQGYYSRALEILDKALCSAKDIDTFLPAVRMLRCFVGTMVTAKIKTCLTNAERIYNGLCKDETSAGSNNCRVLTECYYSGIQRLALECRAISKSETLSSIPSGLEALFKSCMSARQYQDALRLARRYLQWSDVLKPTALLHELIANSEIPSLIKAKAKAAIAESLESQGGSTERDVWYDEAAKLFEENEHAHGSLDISTRIACRSADGENIIDQNLKKYQEMDYPAGLLSALIRLLELVVRLHMLEMQTNIIADIDKLIHHTGTLLLGYMALVQAIAVFGKTLADRKTSVIDKNIRYKYP